MLTNTTSQPSLETQSTPGSATFVAASGNTGISAVTPLSKEPENSGEEDKRIAGLNRKINELQEANKAETMAWQQRFEAMQAQFQESIAKLLPEPEQKKELSLSEQVGLLSKQLETQQQQIESWQNAAKTQQLENRKQRLLAENKDWQRYAAISDLIPTVEAEDAQRQKIEEFVGRLSGVMPQATSSPAPPSSTAPLGTPKNPQQQADDAQQKWMEAAAKGDNAEAQKWQNVYFEALSQSAISDPWAEENAFRLGNQF